MECLWELGPRKNSINESKGKSEQNLNLMRFMEQFLELVGVFKEASKNFSWTRQGKNLKTLTAWTESTDLIEKASKKYSTGDIVPLKMTEIFRHHNLTDENTGRRRTCQNFHRSCGIVEGEGVLYCTGIEEAVTQSIGLAGPLRMSHRAQRRFFSVKTRGVILCVFYI